MAHPPHGLWQDQKGSRYGWQLRHRSGEREFWLEGLVETDGYSARGISRPADAPAGASSIGCVSCGSPPNASRSACRKIALSHIGAAASAARKMAVAIVVTVQARASAVKASVASGHGPEPRNSCRLLRDTTVGALVLGRSAITPPLSVAMRKYWRPGAASGVSWVTSF
jgi:hypothetical protein